MGRTKNVETTKTKCKTYGKITNVSVLKPILIINNKHPAYSLKVIGSVLGSADTRSSVIGTSN